MLSATTGALRCLTTETHAWPWM